MKPRPALRSALLVSLLAAALVPVFADPVTEYYVADRNGIAYERIEPYRKDEFPWVLAVTRDADLEIRALEGAKGEIARWETILSSGSIVTRRYFEEGILRERTSYAYGRPTEMVAATEDGATVTISYAYDGDRLASVTTKDAHGATTRTDTVLYTRSGFAYAVRSVLADGRVEIDAELNLPSKGGDAWKTLGDRELVRKRDRDGNLVYEAVFEKGVVTERISNEYVEKKIRRKTVERPVDGISSVDEYDERGRIMSEISYKGGAELRTAAWSYDRNGRLASVRTTTADSVTLVDYIYRDDGSLASERHSADGELEKVVSYGENEVRTEEYYWKGKVFARTRFEGGKKVSEELLKDGAVVRTRVFP
ncbi:MAG: hypothetical protein NT080_14110 [Spirochaetes bacterium]|nr:hypothetical protein [Spirochaetota bacterium]